MILASITGTTWLMTCMGIGVVFVILILLVFILQIFSAVFTKESKSAAKGAAQPANAAAPTASEDDMKAVAVAVCLYMNEKEKHDYESGVLTIKPTDHSEWHSVLNTRL